MTVFLTAVARASCGVNKLLRTSGGHNLLDIVVLAVNDVWWVFWVFFWFFFFFLVVVVVVVVFSLCGSEREDELFILKNKKNAPPTPPPSLSLPPLISRMWLLWTLSNTDEKKDQ